MIRPNPVRSFVSVYCFQQSHPGVTGFLRELELQSKGTVAQSYTGILLLGTPVLALDTDPVGVMLHLHKLLQ